MSPGTALTTELLGLTCNCPLKNQQPIFLCWACSASDVSTCVCVCMCVCVDQTCSCGSGINRHTLNRATDQWESSQKDGVETGILGLITWYVCPTNLVGPTGKMDRGNKKVSSW